MIDNFDYSQYGTVLSHGKDVISGDGYTSVYDFIEFSEFPKQPGMYTITAVCVAKNSDPEINEPQLVRAKKESGFWSEENNNKVYGSVVRDENYNENKRYIVQFTIDVNPANYGGYTHYLLKNMYDKQNDQIGDLYVKRVGDSNYQGNVTVEYPQFGSKASYSKENVTQTWGGVEEHVFLSLSSFQNTASGTYTVTAICETNNHPNGWNVPDVKYCVTDKTNYGQEYAPSSKQTIVVDGGKNIGAVQFSISFPIANDNNYPYLDIKNIIGGEVKDLKEIRIAVAN